jgi:hypothetical protein
MGARAPVHAHTHAGPFRQLEALTFSRDSGPSSIRVGVYVVGSSRMAMLYGGISKTNFPSFASTLSSFDSPDG